MNLYVQMMSYNAETENVLRRNSFVTNNKIVLMVQTKLLVGLKMIPIEHQTVTSANASYQTAFAPLMAPESLEILTQHKSHK